MHCRSRSFLFACGRPSQAMALPVSSRLAHVANETKQDMTLHHVCLSIINTVLQPLPSQRDATQNALKTDNSRARAGVYCRQKRRVQFAVRMLRQLVLLFSFGFSLGGNALQARTYVRTQQLFWSWNEDLEWVVVDVVVLLIVICASESSCNRM